MKCLILLLLHSKYLVKWLLNVPTLTQTRLASSRGREFEYYVDQLAGTDSWSVLFPPSTPAFLHHLNVACPEMILAVKLQTKSNNLTVLAS